MESKILSYRSLQEVIRLQDKWAEKIKEDEEEGPGVILWQPRPVVTQGRESSDQDLKWEKERYTECSIDRVKVNRGGKTTYHGPGQTVLFPIVHLRRHYNQGLKQWVWNCEQSVIEVLAELGLEGYREPEYPGVWIQGKKIASIGLSFISWISHQGISLNRTRECLAGFDTIYPCGLESNQITCLQDYQREISHKELSQMWLKHWSTLCINLKST